MSHREQLEFISRVKTQYPKFFKKSLVLEIGSLNINGSVRQFFEECVYIGVDVEKGPCVDVVSLGHKYDMPDKSFDVVLSCECFEHNPYWKQTFANMVRMCKQDGLVVFSCATTGRKPHGTPTHEPESSPLTVKLGWDYYNNLTEQDFREEFDFNTSFESYRFDTNNEANDLYFYGIRR